MNSILKIINLISEKAARLSSFSCSPVRLPWFKIHDDGLPVNRLHCLVYARQWRSRNRIKLLIEALVWPVMFVWLACRNALKHGALVDKEYGLGRWKQWSQMLYLGNFYNISPKAYYDLRLFEDGNFKKAMYYLQTHEMDVLYPALYKDAPNGVIDDKALFHQQCVKYGLPVPAILAVFFDGGKEEWLEGRPNELPAGSLFLKFTNASSGLGAEGWAYDGAVRVWRRDHEALDQGQFIHYCREKAVKNKKPVLVQPRLENHQEILSFTGGALSTFRVITYCLPGGKAGILAAGLKMPVGRTDVDNLMAGGIAAGVNPETGMLGPASGLRFGAELMNVHPDTGAQITGHQLVCWREIADISLKAQECFHELWSVGWDIAMTAQGPVLIEGNTYYCYELAQICLRKPLGETIYPSLCLEILGD